MKALTLTEAWLRLLPQQRWFAGKGRRIGAIRVRPYPWQTRPRQWPAVRSEDLFVSFTDGGAQTYQLLSAYRPTDQAKAELTMATVELADLGVLALSDASADPEAFDLFLTPDQLHPAVQRGTPQPLSAEQSNSCVRIGPNALFKLLRRPEPEPNREATLLGRLRHSGVTPILYGESLSADHRVLSLIIEFVESAGDGWKLATTACQQGRDFSAEAAALGRALRKVHSVLGRPYLAEPGSVDVPGSRVAQAMIGRLEEAITEVPELAAASAVLRKAFNALADLKVDSQQIHGDFHLGQALYRLDPPSWVLIDFEGEPLKTPAQRNAPDSVWRDVAGALRSFDYVRGSHPQPDSAATKDWCASASKAFLTGYLDHNQLPMELLRAYELDKAIYEVRYEMGNRPEWAHLPLARIQDELVHDRSSQPE